MRPLAFLLAVLATSPAVTTGQGSPARGPNVVLIMTDDVGYGDIGVYGAPDVKTPNIDALARAGIRLTDFYANGATCTPTRTGLMTGRYQQRFGLEMPLGAGGAADRQRGLPSVGKSLPMLLRNNGYATALVGKWHLGWKNEFSPGAHGFDYFFGFKAGFIDYYTHSNRAGETDLFENEKPVRVDGYMTDLITERSVSFIRQNAHRPFFIDVAYNAAHWPYQVPDKPSIARDNARHLGPFDDSTSTRAEYVALLERADLGVGRILRTLDSLGLRQNTLVIFTNDNGGEWLSRNAPFFHHKGSVWEGGIRVPAILRWPGHIPPGKVSRQVGITMDLTVSILAATKTPVPAGAGFEGIDLLPVLTGRSAEIERTLFWRVQGQQAVRSGEWKLVMDPRPMLFNLRRDPGERTNVIGLHPEIARRLRAALQGWLTSVDSEARRAGAT